MVPILEAILFLAPFIKYVYSYGQKQQAQDDSIKHIKERLERVENSHNGLMLMVSNLQNSITKIETKLDLIIENKIKGDTQ